MSIHNDPSNEAPGVACPEDPTDTGVLRGACMDAVTDRAEVAARAFDPALFEATGEPTMEARLRGPMPARPSVTS